MELTREVIVAMKKCKNTNNCILCIAHKLCKHISSLEAIETLATALLEEMDKPGVWDGSPEWATKAVVNWSALTHYSGVYKEYTRELPKSRERQIAEEVGNNIANKYEWNRDARTLMINTCESALLKYKAELEAGR
jgi:hypothetical protein